MVFKKEKIAKCYFIFLFLFISIGGLYVHKGSSVYSPLKLPYEEDIQIQALLPQEWGFFTKDPREPQQVVYKKVRGEWEKKSFGPNSSPTNYFGLNRQARAQGLELSIILSELDSIKWSNCDNILSKCLREVGSFEDQVDNAIPDPTLCDSIAVVEKKVVPWAWAKDVKHVRSKKIYKMVVQCP